MKLVTTTGYLEKTFGLKKAIDVIAAAGFDGIDMSLFKFTKHFSGENDKKYYLEIRKYAEDKGLYFEQAHAPFPPSFKDDPKKTEHRFGQIVTSIKNASFLGVKHIVVHPYTHLMYSEGNNSEILFEMNMEYYKRLIPVAEEYEIKIAVENMWKRLTPEQIGHSICSRPQEFVRYLHELNNDVFVACLDIGHAYLVGEDPSDFIRTLGNERLKCLHVHDVISENHDSHTLPYFGKIDWQSVTKALAEIDYQGELTYEADNFMVNLPADLCADASKYMERTGRYLINQFENNKKQIKNNSI